MSRRGRLMLGVALGVSVLAAVDTAVWWVATERLAAAWRGWQARLVASGWQVDVGSAHVAGWPFRAALRLDDPHLAQGGAAGVGWEAGRATFGVSLFRPGLLSVELAGAQSVTGFGFAPLHFTAQRLTAVVPLARPVRSTRAVASLLAVEVPGGVMTVAHGELHLAWDDTGTRAVVAAGPVSLPPSKTAGLAPAIDQVSLTLAVQGVWAGGDARAAAAAWRDGGGVVVVRQAALRWGGVTLDATGDARLDADLQPEAGFDVRVNDPTAALTALGSAGAIDQGTAVAAGAVLQILAIPARLAGQGGELDLPLALKRGAVTLARIPVASVPQVRW